MIPDDLLDEIRAFKHRLDLLPSVEKRQMGSGATSVLTQMPAHPFRPSAASKRKEYEYPGIPGPSCPVSGSIYVSFSGVGAPYTIINGYHTVLTWDAGSHSFKLNSGGIDYTAICTLGNTWAVTVADGLVSVFDGAGLEGATITNTQVFGGDVVVTR